MSGRVLVTGGAGFIGSHLVDALVDRGRRVRVLDDLSSGVRENLNPAAEFIPASILDDAALDRALADAETVFHLAAIPSVTRSIEDPFGVGAVNGDGTLRVARRAAAAGVRRIVYASSSAVYGDAPDLPHREDREPRPLSPYAVAKLAGEHFGRVLPGLEFVSVRFFNVYGPRQDPESPYAAVIPIFIGRLEAGLPLPVFGDGMQTRDFMHVSDAASGLLLAAEAASAPGRAYNVATGRSVSILDLAWCLGRVAGREVELEFRPPRPGDIRHSRADIRAAETDLGFRARESLEEGLADTVRWFRRRASAG